MKRFFLYTILSFFLLLPSAGQAPANSNDSIRLSLLTCAPGEEIYSLFGHTAIRYENPSQGIDIVFNYGLFSFNTPNFIFRFSLGETDYQLGVTDYEHFAAEYAFYGRSVWQQTLNLTDEEKTPKYRTDSSTGDSATKKCDSGPQRLVGSRIAAGRAGTSVLHPVFQSVSDLSA